MAEHKATIKNGVVTCDQGDYTSPKYSHDRAEVAAWAHERAMKLKRRSKMYDAQKLTEISER